MNDFISRADAIDMVYGCEDEFGKDVIFRLAEYIRRLPSVQPEVIYCKDCKYIRYDTIFNQAWCNHTKGVTMVCDDAKEYCGRAERKEDGNR